MFGRIQRGVTERPKPSQASNKALPFWIFLSFLIVVGVCLAAFLSMWQPWQPVSKPEPVQTAVVDQDVNKDYRFYDLLPKQQVTPIPEQAIPEHPSVAAPAMVINAENSHDQPQLSVSDGQGAAAAHYVLQVKSFKDPDSADAKRAEIAINGLSADVVISNENKQIWYRVISGPYPSQESAKIAQQTLQNGGIDSIIVRHGASAQ